MAKAAKKEVPMSRELPEGKAEKREEEQPIEMPSLEEGLPEGVERVGNHMEVQTLGGPELPAVYAGKAGEKLHVIALDAGEAKIPDAARARVTIIAEGQLEARPAAAQEAASLEDSYDKVLEATLSAQGIDGDEARLIEQVAETRKGLYLAMSTRAEDPSHNLAEMISGLIERSPEELAAMASPVSLREIETVRRQSEQSVIESAGTAAIKKAEEGRLLSAQEATMRRIALNEQANEAEQRAAAEGFVELMNSPLYQEGAEPTRARIQEIEDEMRAFDEKSESERSSAEEININMLWDERKRHMAVLPTLEKYEGLEKKLEEVDQRKESAVQEHVKSVTSALRSVWGKIGNRVSRVNALEKLVQARDGFIEFWKETPFGGMEEDAEVERNQAQERLETLQSEIERLRNDEEFLKESGVALDFDPSAEIEPAKTELYDHLLTLAKDGDTDSVGDYIEMRLDQDNLSDAERNVLEKALEDIDNRAWMEDKEAPLGLEIGDSINLELSPKAVLKAEVVGFTPDNRVTVKLENGAVRTFDSKFVVKRGETAEAQEAMVAEREEKEFFEEGDKMELETLTAREQNLEVADLRAFKELYESMTEMLKTIGRESALEELPSSWDEFLKADKKADKKGVMGWFKKTFGGPSEQKKMMQKMLETYRDYQDELMNTEISAEVSQAKKEQFARMRQRLQDAQKRISIQMPGNL